MNEWMQNLKKSFPILHACCESGCKPCAVYTSSPWMLTAAFWERCFITRIPGSCGRDRFWSQAATWGNVRGCQERATWRVTHTRAHTRTHSHAHTCTHAHTQAEGAEGRHFFLQSPSSRRSPFPHDQVNRLLSLPWSSCPSLPEPPAFFVSDRSSLLKAWPPPKQEY